MRFGQSAIRRLRILDLTVGLWFLIAWVATFPAPLWWAGAGLDMSWLQALHLALANGLVFGRDILFTYGPLGYLYFPLGLSAVLWTEAVLFRVTIHTLFYIILLMLVLKSENRLFNGAILAFSATVIEADLAEAYLLTAIFVLITAYIITEEHYSLFPWLSAFAATTPFFKIDVGFASLTTIILGAVWLYFKQYRRHAILSLATCVSVFMLVGILLTHSANTLASFVAGSYQLVVGFGPAMAVAGPLWEVYVGIIAGSAFVLCLIREMSVGKVSSITFLSLGFLFFSYKEGFVRHDLGHIIIFFGACALFFGLIQIRERDGFVRGGCVLVLVLLLISQSVVFYTAHPGSLIPGVTYNTANFTDTIELMSHPGVSSSRFSSSLAYVRNEYPLSQPTIQTISNHTVDIFPWDVAIALAYGMEWNPRPVFQSYSAYTSYLDNLNSRHFLDSNAPDFVLYAVKSIDGRYPLFDEPLTLRALICNYEVMWFDGDFMVLRRVADHCGPPTVIQTIESAFNRTITVPSNYNGCVFGQVHMQYNFIGTLGNLLYKVPPVNVELHFADGSTGTYRFVFGNAMDGLIVSALPNNLFGGQIRPVREIKFTTEGAYAFDPDIQVSFIRIPVSYSPGQVAWSTAHEPDRWVHQGTNILPSDGVYHKTDGSSQTIKPMPYTSNSYTHLFTLTESRTQPRTELDSCGSIRFPCSDQVIELLGSLGSC